MGTHNVYPRERWKTFAGKTTLNCLYQTVMIMYRISYRTPCRPERLSNQHLQGRKQPADMYAYRVHVSITAAVIRRRIWHNAETQWRLSNALARHFKKTTDGLSLFSLYTLNNSGGKYAFKRLTEWDSCISTSSEKKKVRNKGKKEEKSYYKGPIHNIKTASSRGL